MRYWVGSLAIVAVLGTTACDRSPAGPERTSREDDPRVFASADEELPWADLSAIRFEGFDPGTQISFDLELEGIGARYWPNPEFAPGPNWQPMIRWLQFTGSHGNSSGSDGNRIEGAGRIQETPKGIFGLGKITAFVRGTFTTPSGTERITGRLTFDLAKDLIVPIKGDSFFEPCGTGCIDFGAQPLFTPDPNFNIPPSPIVGELIAARAIFVTSIATGGLHTCALTGFEGKAYCWGSNDRGRLGDGTTRDRTFPRVVSGGLNFTAITAGSSGHTCGLTEFGEAYCWGSNPFGQLGDGTRVDRLTPVAVTGGLTFTAITAGDGYTCALALSGSAYCWGSNGLGQLGNGEFHEGEEGDQLSPVAVVGGMTFSDITAYGNLTCGIERDGTAHCWGADLERIIVHPSGVPFAIPGGLAFSDIDAGNNHVCGLSDAGRAYCWGYNFFGQLGDGSNDHSSSPVEVVGAPRYSAIRAGGPHSCALLLTGEAYCWGANDAGQLGDGGHTDRNTPVAVAVGFGFHRIDTGIGYSCGVSRGRNAYCWGGNSHGQLGDGTITDRDIPTLVEFFPRAAAIP